jgi:hypothetical protein
VPFGWPGADVQKKVQSEYPALNYLQRQALYQAANETWKYVAPF